MWAQELALTPDQEEALDHFVRVNAQLENREREQRESKQRHACGADSLISRRHWNRFNRAAFSHAMADDLIARMAFSPKFSALYWMRRGPSRRH